MKITITSLIILILSFNLANALPSLSVTNLQEVTTIEQKASILTSIKKQVIKWNIYINKQVPKYMSSLKKNPSLKTIFIVMFASLIYGILHTLGPGHGKMVVATYFLTNNTSSIWRGLAVGTQFSFAHIGGAVLLVIIADFSFKSFVSSQSDSIYYLKILSYSLIIIIGFVMFIKSLIEAYTNKKVVGCSCHHHKQESAVSWAAGLIPCTGSLLILLYAMANDILTLGLLMVACVALGMTITVTTLGVICILGKNKVLDKFSSIKALKLKSFNFILQQIGALIIMFIGAVLLLVSL